MKKLTLLLLLTICFVQCREFQEIDGVKKDSQNFISKTTIEKESALKDALEGLNASSNGRTLFSHLPDSIIKLIDPENGAINFTLHLGVNPDDQFLEDLIVYTSTEGEVAYEIHRYRPTYDYIIENEKMLGENFSGTFEIQDIEGNTVLSMDLEDGLPKEDSTETEANGRITKQYVDCYILIVSTYSRILSYSVRCHAYNSGGSSFTPPGSGSSTTSGGGSRPSRGEYSRNVGSSPRATSPRSPSPIKLADSWELNKVELSDDFKDNDCAMKVLNGLTKSDAMYNVIKDFLNNTFQLNLKLVLDVQHSPCNRVYNKACTNPNYNGQEVTITFKEGYLRQASPISVARTFLHEAIHAHLIYYHRAILQKELIKWNDFPGLWDYMERNNYNLGKANHAQMAAHYRRVIIKGMKEFDKYYGQSHSTDFYEAMSWGGLHNEAGYKNSYDKIISAEQNKGGCQ